MIMKKLFLIMGLFAGAICAGQEAKLYSFMEIPHDSTMVSRLPDLEYYSKNYDKVFGDYYYSFDTMSFGARNVYVSDSNFYYNGSQNMPYIQPLNQCYLPSENNKFAGAIGVSVAGLAALLKGDVFAKDYSPKDVDESLFHPKQ
jgi:hypothetical protein